MKFDEIKEKNANGTYQCDSCKATFKGDEITLKPAATNIQFGPGWAMLVVDKEGVIHSTQNFKDGDQTLACPKCGHVHLHGFDLVKKEVA